MSPGEILACAGARWSPGIGDPTVLGWATVAIYALAAVLCGRLAASPAGRAERRFWWGLAALMAALAVNKQLDLQSALTAAGRCVAQIQGWYGARRQVQLWLVEGLVALSAAGLAWMLWAMRRSLRRVWPAVLGTALVAGFVAVRAMGFHHVDAFIGWRVGMVRTNHALEIGGTALVALNALVLLRRGRP